MLGSSRSAPAKGTCHGVGGLSLVKAEDACVGVGESCQPGLPMGDAFLEELAKKVLTPAGAG